MLSILFFLLEIYFVFIFCLCRPWKWQHSLTLAFLYLYVCTYVWSVKSHFFFFLGGTSITSLTKKGYSLEDRKDISRVCLSFHLLADVISSFPDFDRKSHIKARLAKLSIMFLYQRCIPSVFLKAFFLSHIYNLPLSLSFLCSMYKQTVGKTL